MEDASLPPAEALGLVITSARDPAPHGPGLPFLHTHSGQDSHWPDCCFSSLCSGYEARPTVTSSDVKRAL